MRRVGAGIERGRARRGSGRLPAAADAFAAAPSRALGGGGHLGLQVVRPGRRGRASAGSFVGAGLAWSTWSWPCWWNIFHWPSRSRSVDRGPLSWMWTQSALAAAGIASSEGTSSGESRPTSRSSGPSLPSFTSGAPLAPGVETSARCSAELLASSCSLAPPAEFDLVIGAGSLAGAFRGFVDVRAVLMAGSSRRVRGWVGRAGKRTGRRRRRGARRPRTACRSSGPLRCRTWPSPRR